jgi:hypothetical protein
LLLSYPKAQEIAHLFYSNAGKLLRKGKSLFRLLEDRQIRIRSVNFKSSYLSPQHLINLQLECFRRLLAVKEKGGFIARP